MNYKIGDIVRYSTRYARKCSGRFRNANGNATAHPVPLKQPRGDGFGVVVGIRNVMMDNYCYHAPTGGYMGDDDEAPYATGDRENVLLVTDSIYEEPFIVRLTDAEIAKP